MEPVAVCHTTITPKLFRESHAVVFDRKKQRTLLLCGIVFAAFGLAFLLVQYLLNRVIVLGGIRRLTQKRHAARAHLREDRSRARRARSRGKTAALRWNVG